MEAPERKYLRIPRNAEFPTLPVPIDFQEYSHAYFVGAKELWEKTGKAQHRGVPNPDNLVYPILFLVHHFLELELKSGIVLTYSIGNMTGEITEERNWRNHDLICLLSILQENLARLEKIPEGRPSPTSRELIEDMAKFGMLGESPRYPITNVNKATKEKAIGEGLPDGLIPDTKAVIKLADKAWKDFNGLISYLIEYEDKLYFRR